MKQRFRKLDQDLCYEAVADFMQKGKFDRNDVLSYIEEWCGYSREEIMADEAEHGGRTFRLKFEIMDELSLALLDMIEDCVKGIDPDFDEVHEMYKPDGGTGKMRMIAYLSVRMQLLGHALKLGLEPLLWARILPWQHASLPKRGPKKLIRQLRRALQKKTGIKYFQKTDCTSAYRTSMYARIITLIWSEIPRANWILRGLLWMQRYAPGGHLIIGGYLDAWLFNFILSYMLKYVMSLYYSRRGNEIPFILATAFYMDDGVFCGSNAKTLAEAVRRCGEWLKDRFGIRMRTTTGIIRLLSLEEEVERRGYDKPAKRGFPMIDIAGFRVSRSRIILRKRNNRKIIRCALRSWEEYGHTGTLKAQRAFGLISKNGMVRNSDSKHLIRKYNLDGLLAVAKAIQRYWCRKRQKRRKEVIQYVAEKYRKYCETIEGERFARGWYRAFGRSYHGSFA